MIERMGENDAIVTRYMADKEFQGSAFPILAREIFEAVRGRAGNVDGELPLSNSRETRTDRTSEEILLGSFK